MNILVTGGRGFLGRYILEKLSVFNIQTLGRSKMNDLEFDLGSCVPNISTHFNLVIHSAGKAHEIPRTEKEKDNFFLVNVCGTRNLLKGLERAPSLPRSFVFISSVAVYGLTNGRLVAETTNLNASDAYGQSKIQAERIVQEWCKKNSVICTVLRLPLLVGSNPPGNLGNMIKAIEKGYYFNISGGTAKKSMVMAEDVASIILKAADIGGVYNLTDKQHPTFIELSKKIAKELEKSRPSNIPFWLAKFLAIVGDTIGPTMPINSSKLNKITTDLTFDDSKATLLLNWNPMSVIDNFIVK